MFVVQTCQLLLVHGGARIDQQLIGSLETE
jgi:hypothetical protein